MGQSDIVTKFLPDVPIVLNAEYDRGDADRRRIDDQIRGTQFMLAENLLNGALCSGFKLSPTSEALTPGMAFCTSPDGLARKATAAALATSAVLGVVTVPVNPGANFRGVLLGIIPRALSGIPAGAAGAVRVNPTTALIERVGSADPADVLMGLVDDTGTVVIVRGGAAAAGGDGGGSGSGVTIVQYVETEGDNFMSLSVSDGDGLSSASPGQLVVDGDNPSIGALILHGGQEYGSPYTLYGLWRVVSGGSSETNWHIQRVDPPPAGLVYVMYGPHGQSYWAHTNGAFTGFRRLEFVGDAITRVTYVAIDGDVLNTGTNVGGKLIHGAEHATLFIDGTNPGVGDLILHGGAEPGWPLLLAGIWRVTDIGAPDGDGTTGTPWVIEKILPEPAGLVYVQGGNHGGTYWAHSEGAINGFRQLEFVGSGAGLAGTRYVDPYSSLDPATANGTIERPFSTVTQAVASLGVAGTIYVFGGQPSEIIVLPPDSEFTIEGLGYPGVETDHFPVHLGELQVGGSTGAGFSALHLRRISFGDQISSDGNPVHLSADECVFSLDLNGSGQANLAVTLSRSTVLGSITCTSFVADDSRIGHDVTSGAGEFTARGCVFDNGGSPQALTIGATKATLLECDVSHGNTSSPFRVIFGTANSELVVDPYTFGLATDGMPSGAVVLTNGYLHALGAEAPSLPINADTTLTRAHANRYLRVNSDNAQLTIAPAATTPWKLGTEFEGIQVHATGQITFVAGAGVTINPSTLKTRTQWSWWRLKNVALNQWDLTGDLA